MKKILIDYLYIEGTQIYAVEKTTGAVQGPPRLFSLEGRDEYGNYTSVEVAEIDYR